MPLSDTKIKTAKPRDKQYRLSDQRGLYCLVKPTGSKLWRYDYRFEGIRKTLALGIYPDVLLKRAREKHQDARRLLDNGIDPSAVKRAEKIALAGKDSFEAIAREWYEKHKPKWSDGYAAKVITRLEQGLFPYIGNKGINEITPPILLLQLKRIEKRGAIELSHRVKGLASQVFRYAIATGRAERDPAPDLKGALAPVVSTHHAAITDPRAVSELLRAIDGFTGTQVVKHALQLSPLLFLRPGELRHGTWDEIDTEKKQWRIPENKMKKRRKHIVPLSDQAIKILEELRPLTERPNKQNYIFPSARSFDRPMSENTVNAALRRLGYAKDEMSAHGFRGMASTILHEQGWQTEYIELQLAHMEGNQVKAAYNHAQHMDERTKMMQAWSDYLYGLKEDEENRVVQLRQRVANE